MSEGKAGYEGLIGRCQYCAKEFGFHLVVGAAKGCNLVGCIF